MLSSAFFAVLRVRGFFSGFTSAAPSSFALFEAVAFLAARFLAGTFSSVAAAESVAVDAVFLVFFAFAAFFGASASSAWASTDVVFDEKAQHFDEGYMTVEQVNLLLKTLPIDITFVDEHDKVIFYNRGEERVFPRSAGIIGREVKFCHPPKSVGTVLKIVEAFRNGTQNEANFWLNFRGRLIYVRYFAVRDAQKNYKGVIEMSQDITDIKTIEGERRLLEWE